MNLVKVLIADDSPKLLSVLQIQLEAHDFDVMACTDAYMALEQARKFKPDVMVLDIRMPAGDGFSVQQRMSKIPELKTTPVIYITGDPSFQLDLKAEQVGAFGLIHKPLSLAELVKMIESAVKHQREGVEAQPESTQELTYNIPDETNPSEIPGVAQ